MTLDRRIDLLANLGEYMQSDNERWMAAKELAIARNAWFTPAHIEIAANNIAKQFLQKDALTAWASEYQLPAEPKKVGIVMAGNIPLVGFHDFLCAFVAGHHAHIKLSEKDPILLPHLVRVMAEQDGEVNSYVHFSEMLKGCDAYIATGSNNTARYFEQYFGKYPHLIRRNRTSVAVLDGSETEEELTLLGEDIFTHFGLGCRNVTGLCVPQGYDFTLLLDVLKKYEHFMDHNKYRNNYDYHLALYLLNKVPYITNESVLLVENDLPFSAVSVLHYRYYDNKEELMASLIASPDIQAIMGHGALPFGSAQSPALKDYADGVDTMGFLCGL